PRGRRDARFRRHSGCVQFDEAAAGVGKIMTRMAVAFPLDERRAATTARDSPVRRHADAPTIIAARKREDLERLGAASNVFLDVIGAHHPVDECGTLCETLTHLRRVEL